MEAVDDVLMKGKTKPINVYAVLVDSLVAEERGKQAAARTAPGAINEMKEQEQLRP